VDQIHGLDQGRAITFGIDHEGLSLSSTGEP
jgi:hypothetical protein